MASKRDHGAQALHKPNPCVCVSQRAGPIAAPAEHHAPAAKSAKVQHEEDKKARRCGLASRAWARLGAGANVRGLCRAAPHPHTGRPRCLRRR